MNKNRSVKHISFAQEMDMGGFPVRQPLPNRDLDQLDPFLLLHHAEVNIAPGTDHSQAGIGPHPHRGFSPVTFIYKGGVHHRDSLGNSSIIGENGVQWVNSGRGIIHSERPPKKLALTGGTQELIQLWVNTPAQNKMDTPLYQPLKSNQRVAIPGDGLTTIHLIAGDFMEASGPVQSQSDVIALMIEMKKNGEFYFPVPTGHNLFLYLLDGHIKTSNQSIPGKNMIIYNNDGEGTTVYAADDTRILLMSGKPLNEPFYSYGPFVVNNQNEIHQAIKDYQSGAMGTLNEKF